MSLVQLSEGQPIIIALIIFLVGAAIGAITGYFICLQRNRQSLDATKSLAKTLATDMAEAMTTSSQKAQDAALDRAMNEMKSSFSSLSVNVLSKSTDELIKRSKEIAISTRELSSKDLENKKSLIDSQLENLHKDLHRMTELVRSMEKERGDQLGSMAEQLRNTNAQTASLIETTSNLSDVLSNSQTRGQWGERIAEDVLKLAGFIENINYTKQETLSSGARPDYTFMLPQNLFLNMDVKFPIANYSRYIESNDKNEKAQLKKSFLKDVKARLKEVTGRGYISEMENTVDCVLLFVPNEQVFSFIQYEYPDFFDEALRNKVICCSPMTLFAVLAVVRQSVDNFSLERTSGEILVAMSGFKKQWVKYLEKFENLGKKINDAQNEYEVIATTRTRLLDRSLDKIEKIRQKKHPASSNLDSSDKDLLE